MRLSLTIKHRSKPLGPRAKVAASVIAVCAIGCVNPFEFDDIKKTTPLVKTGGPDGSMRFGSKIAASTGFATGEGSTFFTWARTGTDTNPEGRMVQADITASGSVSTTDADLNGQGDDQGARMAGTVAADTPSAVVVVQTAPGGTPQWQLRGFSASDQGPIGGSISAPVTEAIIGVGANGPDVVGITNGTIIMISGFLDGSPDEDVCDLPANVTGRDIILADVDGTAGPEVAVVVDDNGQGKLLIFAPSQFGASNCPTPAMANTEIMLDDVTNARVAVGEFNGASTPDVAIAGGTTVRVIFDATDSADVVDLPVPDSPQAPLELAVGPLNPTTPDNDVLVVGSRGTTVDDKANAGAVYLFEFDTGTEFQEAARMIAPSPVENQDFGVGVAVGEFNGAGLLLIGSEDELFTAFRHPINTTDDPRE